MSFVVVNLKGLRANFKAVEVLLVPGPIPVSETRSNLPLYLALNRRPDCTFCAAEPPERMAASLADLVYSIRKESGLYGVQGMESLTVCTHSWSVVSGTRCSITNVWLLDMPPQAPWPLLLGYYDHVRNLRLLVCTNVNWVPGQHKCIMIYYSSRHTRINFCRLRRCPASRISWLCVISLTFLIITSTGATPTPRVVLYNGPLETYVEAVLKHRCICATERSHVFF